MRYGGPDIFQRAVDGRVRFTDDAFIRAGDEIIRQVRAGYFPAGVNGLSSDQGQDRMMFYQEQAAMMIMTSGTVSSILNENPDFFHNKLGVSVYPAIDGSPGRTTDVLAGNNVFSVSSNCRNQDMAAKFVAFLATDEELQQAFLNTGSIPILQRGLRPSTTIMEEVIQQVATSTHVQNFIDQTLSAEHSQMHLDTVQALFGQTMTSRQAAEQMQRSFDTQ